MVAFAVQEAEVYLIALAFLVVFGEDVLVYHDQLEVEVVGQIGPMLVCFALKENTVKHSKYYKHLFVFMHSTLKKVNLLLNTYTLFVISNHQF